MSSPVLKGAVRKFCGKNCCDFCVIQENHENIWSQNLELYVTGTGKMCGKKFTNMDGYHTVSQTINVNKLHMLTMYPTWLTANGRAKRPVPRLPFTRWTNVWNSLQSSIICIVNHSIMWCYWRCSVVCSFVHRWSLVHGNDQTVFFLSAVLLICSGTISWLGSNRRSAQNDQQMNTHSSCL